MRTQHTPGPWTAYNSDNGRIFKQWRINAGTFHQVATVAERESSEEEHANAALIASAPDLLAALKACVERMAELQEHTNYPLAWPRVMAADAIAKAEGKV